MSYFIGLDLGGTNLKAGLVDKAGRVLAHASIPTEGDKGPQHVISRMIKLTFDVAAQANLTIKDVAAIGIGTPGQISIAEGMVLSAPNMPGWNRVPIRQLIAQGTGLPATLDNDANAAAFGEFFAGAGRVPGLRHMVLLTIGTGIGGGVVIDGKLVRGAFDTAMEVGHMIIVPDGRQCPCGQNGCLEAYASATAIARHANRRLDQGEPSVMSAKYSPSTPVTCRDVFDAAAQMDTLAVGVVEQAVDYLGLACVTITRMFDPQMIVFGGGVVAAGDLLFDRIRRCFADRTWRLLPERLTIVPAKLGNDAGFIGSAALAAQSVGQLSSEYAATAG